MILNLLILVFLVLMAYWWGWLQGLFSSFLHLCVVVVAGALAIALWEPLAYLLLATNSVATTHAWGLSLIALMVALTLCLRLALDKLISANVQFHQLINIFVGGFLGLLSGILLSGLTIIGIGFLPLAPDILGYQPLIVDANNGQVKANTNSTLWFPVDHWTANFYQALSAGSFYGGTPLDVYRDNLATQSALFRLRETFDRNLSTVAVPHSVSVLTHFQQSLKLSVLPANIQQQLQLAAGPNPEPRIVFVDTQWETTQGTFDTDGALRVASTQVRLTAQGGNQDDAPAQVFAPAAVSVLDQNNMGRTFVPLTNETNFAKITSRKGQLGWIFIIPADLTPRFILLRQLRLDLPESREIPADQFVAALGSLGGSSIFQPPASNGQGTPAGTGVVSPPNITGMGAAGVVTKEVEVTNMLPQAISRNMANSFQYQGQDILAGSGSVNRPSFALSKETRVDRFSVPDHQVMVRLKVTKDRGHTIFGQAPSGVRMLEPIWIDDSSGDRNLPVAYVRYRPGDSNQLIHIDRLNPISSAKQTPISSMQGDDELYLYFLVPKGARVTAYHLGNTVTQSLSVDIPR